MGRFASLLSVVSCASRVVAGPYDWSEDDQAPLRSDFDIEACPDYTLYAAYPQ